MIMMVIVIMMVVMVMMWFVPTTLNKNITAIPFLPARFNPYSATARRHLPMTSHPFVASPTIRPITINPDVIA